jgi:hypothetical protein
VVRSIVRGGVVVFFVAVLVPIRGTGSIRNPGCALPTFGKVLVMVNLAANMNKTRIVLAVLSRGRGVAWLMLSTHGRKMALKVELQVKTVTNSVNSVKLVAYGVDLSAEDFNSGLGIMKLLGNGENLCILKRSVGAFFITYMLSFRVKGLGNFGNEFRGLHTTRVLG